MKLKIIENHKIKQMNNKTTKGERVKSEGENNNNEYAIAQEVRMSGHWLIVLVYPSRPIVSSPSSTPPPLLLFFIDRSTIPSSDRLGEFLSANQNNACLFF